MNDPTYVYVAGPYRPINGGGSHDWHGYCDIDANINEARRWSIRLAQAGIPFFCPHLNSAHFEVFAPDVPPDYWLNMDIKLLQFADAIFLLPNWRKSSGTLAEKDYALEHGISVYTHRMFDRLVDDWNNSKCRREPCPI
jgi:nucleoside 2-deoxyribosyltransferase